MKRFLHALLALCFTATVALAQTGVVDTKSQLTTDINTNWADNSSGAITPQVARQTLLNAVVSLQQAPRVNAQSGTTYTVTVDDYGKLITSSNGSAVAVSLPQATTNFATFNFALCVQGTGTVTITPTTSTINGAATLVLPQGTCSVIVSDGTNWQATWPTVGNNGVTCSLTSGQLACGLTAARRTLPTTSIATTGSHTGGMSANTSGTYTTPANVLWIEIWLVGSGGGGSGGDGGAAPAAGGSTCWNTSGTACTSPVYSALGGAGQNNGRGGLGGSTGGSSTCTWGVDGGDGQGIGLAATTNMGGGHGGASTRGGSGSGGWSNTLVGLAGKANSGGGGGGGGGTAVAGGAGGGAGGTCYVIINSPAASYTYTVGAGSAGAAAGGGGSTAGGNGADGIIIVVEHYGS